MAENESTTVTPYISLEEAEPMWRRVAARSTEQMHGSIRRSEIGSTRCAQFVGFMQFFNGNLAMSGTTISKCEWHDM